MDRDGSFSSYKKPGNKASSYILTGTSDVHGTRYSMIRVMAPKIAARGTAMWVYGRPRSLSTLHLEMKNQPIIMQIETVWPSWA